MSLYALLLRFKSHLKESREGHPPKFGVLGFELFLFLSNCLSTVNESDKAENFKVMEAFRLEILYAIRHWVLLPLHHGVPICKEMKSTRSKAVGLPVDSKRRVNSSEFSGDSNWKLRI